jgi:hypothetical protein
MGYGILRRRREEREMMLTELAAGGRLHRLPVVHAPGRSVRGGAADAAEPLSRIDHVIAVHRPPGGAYDTAGRHSFDRGSLEPPSGASSMSMISGKA